MNNFDVYGEQNNIGVVTIIRNEIIIETTEIVSNKKINLTTDWKPVGIAKGQDIILNHIWRIKLSKYMVFDENIKHPESKLLCLQLEQYCQNKFREILREYYGHSVVSDKKQSEIKNVLGFEVEDLMDGEIFAYQLLVAKISKHLFGGFNENIKHYLWEIKILNKFMNNVDMMVIALKEYFK